MPREIVTAYRFINHRCEECSERADIEITYKQVPIPRGDPIEHALSDYILGSLDITRYYCAEHSPIDIEAEKTRWLKIASIPPGRE